MRSGPLKLIVPHAHDRRQAWGDYLTEPALYDVIKDPAEKNNLATQQPEEAARLSKLLDGWWDPSAKP